MPITWKDIKYTTLQKMFSVTGSQTTIPNDSATMEYVNAMPAAFNEALELLSTAGKFIIKEYQYINFPMDNLLGKDTFKTYTVVNDSLEFSCDTAKSFYFKISGKPFSCKLFVGEDEVKDFFPEEEEGIDYRPFRMFKGNVPIPDEAEDLTVKLVIEAKSPVNISNVCFYEAEFLTDDDVPQYEEYIRIKMTDVLDDFYQLAPAELYSLGNGSEYIVADNYFQEADKTLVIQRNKPGIYVIHYRAYPQHLTLSTPDDTELSLDPEVAALVPLYMASQLYNKITSTNKSSFNTLVKSCKYYADSDYTYFGLFDAKDFINKLAANSTFNPGSTYTNAVLAAHGNLVAYSSCGKGAGNSYGLCMFWSVSSSCSKSTYYTSSQTNFSNWRSIVSTYGS